MVDYSSAESPLAGAPDWKSLDVTKLNPDQRTSLNQYMQDHGQGGVAQNTQNYYVSPSGAIGGEPNAYNVKTGGYNEPAGKKKKGKGFSDFLIPIAATVGSMFLGPEIGLGLSGLGMGAGAETLGGALAGGAIGAGASALEGGDPLKGGLFGAIGGGVGPNIGDITNGVFGGAGGANPTGTPLASSIPGTSGGAAASGGAAGAVSAPSSVAGGAGAAGGDVTFQSDFPTGVNGASSGGNSFSSGGFGSSVSGGGANSYAPGGSNFVSQGDAGSQVSAGAAGPSSSGATSSSLGSSIKIPGGGAAGNNVSGAGAAASAGSEGGFGSFIKDPSFSSFGKALNANSGLLTSAAGLGKDIIGAMSGNPELDKLKGTAENLGAQGDQLRGYLASGTLPPGVQGGINQATESAKAAIRSRYASMGMSGSSAEQQDLASVDANASTQGANIAMSLLQQGVQESGLSSELYKLLLDNTLESDKSFGSALANLGSAVAGNGKAA